MKKYVGLGFMVGMAIYGAISLAGCGDEASVTEVQGAQQVSTYIGISQTTSSNVLKPPGEGDWAPGWVKTECGGTGSGLVIGISFSYVRGVGVNHRMDCNSAQWPVDDYDYYVLNVRSRNDDRAVIGYDWAPGYDKGSCPIGYGISGIATDPSGGHGLAYIKCNRISGYHNPNNIGLFSDQNAWASVGPFREDASEPSISWDPGYNLDQCGDGRFMVGIAHGSDQRAAVKLCAGDPYGTVE